MAVQWYVKQIPVEVEGVPDAKRHVVCNQFSEVFLAPSGKLIFSGDFKGAFQDLYRQRARDEELIDFCARCGTSSERKGQGKHQSWCRVPSEEAEQARRFAADPSPQHVALVPMGFAEGA